MISVTKNKTKLSNNYDSLNIQIKPSSSPSGGSIQDLLILSLML